LLAGGWGIISIEGVEVRDDQS